MPWALIVNGGNINEPEYERNNETATLNILLH